MKIKSISSGYVWRKKNSHNETIGYGFCFHVIDGLNRRQTVESLQTFSTASMAKQAMREKVHHERIRNGLINSGLSRKQTKE